MEEGGDRIAVAGGNQGERKRAHTSSARQGERRGRRLIYSFVGTRLHYLACCELHVQASQGVSIIDRRRKGRKSDLEWRNERMKKERECLIK